MCVQVGKAWAPSVVYIGDCEKTWMKKVPKTDKVSPVLLVLLENNHSNACIHDG